ncbi:MAG: hypothetical protein PHV99_01415 [Candidatus Pacebacteria bacterium]|nr:hypothetical protein [Candidatus Paceibacterota bacterium]
MPERFPDTPHEMPEEAPVTPEVDRDDTMPPELVDADIDDFLDKEAELDEERDHPNLPN